jgi:hypothetical protein
MFKLKNILFWNFFYFKVFKFLKCLSFEFFYDLEVWIKNRFLIIIDIFNSF